MQRIDEGPRKTPPSPWGMAIIMEGDQLRGIVTDGNIRRAILQGKSLEEPIASIMTTDPLRIHAGTSRAMLTELHDHMRRRGGSESTYHHILVVDEDGALVDAITPFELWRRSDVRIKTVAVIGLGYVGLTLALTLNEFGIRVIGIDTNEEVMDKLRKGLPHFFERGLAPLLTKHANALLTFQSTLKKEETDIFVVCVGTPVDEQGHVLTTFLEEASRNVGRVLKPHDLVILRSTVPIGTCRSLVIPILEEESGLSAERDFFLAFAPERTVEGRALEELRTLPQVIGGINKQSIDVASQFFQIFTRTIVSVNSLEEAEAVKLLNNTFRDVSFGFANEAAHVLSRYGITARSVICAANEGYTRNTIPPPSPGVGGACLVKDPHLFAQSARAKGYEPRLPPAARAVNTSMIDFVAGKVHDFLRSTGRPPASAKILLMGMAFKGTPETSDIRFSTSVDILRRLQATFPTTTIYDPIVHRSDLEALGAPVVEDPAQGFRGADAVLVLNNHQSFADLDIFTLATTMRRPGLLFDPWGAYTAEQLSACDGIAYVGL